jgi:hypothetical protein
MKEISFFLFSALLLAACENTDDSNSIIVIDSKVDFTITYSDGTDSMKFYYNTDKKLIKVDWYDSSDSYTTDSLIYRTKLIEKRNVTYYLDDSGNIILFKSNDGLRIEYRYNEGFVVYQKSIYNGDVTQEIYFIYENSVRIKDSVIDYSDGNQQSVIVNEYIYTDTLTPDFLVDESGFFEFRNISKYLIREAPSYSYLNGIKKDDDIEFKFQYEISDSSLNETVYAIHLGQKIRMLRGTYILNKK